MHEVVVGVFVLNVVLILLLLLDRRLGDAIADPRRDAPARPAAGCMCRIVGLFSIVAAAAGHPGGDGRDA